MNGCEVALVYNCDSPEVEIARSNLLEAFHAAGLPPRWREFDVTKPMTPSQWQSCPTPSIFINGDTIWSISPGAASQPQPASDSQADSAVAVPTVEQLASKLEAARRSQEQALARGCRLKSWLDGSAYRHAAAHLLGGVGRAVGRHVGLYRLPALWLAGLAISYQRMHRR